MQAKLLIEGIIWKDTPEPLSSSRGCRISYIMEAVLRGGGNTLPGQAVNLSVPRFPTCKMGVVTVLSSWR